MANTCQKRQKKIKLSEADRRELADDLSHYVYHIKEMRPHRQHCPRCGTRSIVNAGFPYCEGCNWDSLEDPTWSHL